MSKVILHWVFDFDFEKNEPFEDTLTRAHEFKKLDGFIWKIWLRDRTTNRGGGVYLFDNRESAQSWVDRFKDIPLQPWTSNSHFEIIEVDEALSSATFASLTRNQSAKGE